MLMLSGITGQHQLWLSITPLQSSAVYQAVKKVSFYNSTPCLGHVRVSACTLSIGYHHHQQHHHHSRHTLATTTGCDQYSRARSVLRKRFAQTEQLSLFALTARMTRKEAAQLFYQVCGAPPGLAR